MQNRVVVTGLGPLSPRGAGWESLWRLFLHPAGGDEPDAPQGDRPCGLRLADSWDTGRNEAPREVDALACIAREAVDLATTDAELDAVDVDAGDVGVALSTGYGCLGADPSGGASATMAGLGALAQRARGPRATFHSAAALEALEFGFRQVAGGRAAMMIVASADRLYPSVVEAFAARGGLSPSGKPRPFDRSRDGTVLSEGSCALVLEEYRAARRRGAIIYAEILATGQSHVRGGSLDCALEAAVSDALEGAGVDQEQVEVVFAGASGAVQADLSESRGLWAALGEHAGRVPITCPKSVLGETLGNAGTFAAMLAALSLRTGRIPPTAHYRDPDPRCPLNIQSSASDDLAPSLALVPVAADGGRGGAALLRRCS